MKSGFSTTFLVLLLSAIYHQVNSEYPLCDPCCDLLGYTVQMEIGVYNYEGCPHVCRRVFDVLYQQGKIQPNQRVVCGDCQLMCHQMGDGQAIANDWAGICSRNDCCAPGHECPLPMDNTPEIA